jgi:hypothetical protein
MVQLQGTPAGQCRRLLARWAEAATAGARRAVLA